MRVFQETTNWKEHNVPNHIYYTSNSKSKIVAFYNILTGEVKKFKEPIRWDTRYRTFKELKPK